METIDYLSDCLLTTMTNQIIDRRQKGSISYDIAAILLKGAKESGRDLVANSILEWFTPKLKRIAASASYANDKQEMSEQTSFLGDSIGLLWMKIDSYQPNYFRSWFRQVCKNEWLTKRGKASKKSEREQRHRESLSVSDLTTSDKDDGALHWVLMNLSQPMTWADIGHLFCCWKDRERVELFAFHGLFRKIPKAIWETMLKAYESTMNVTLSRPFPAASYSGGQTELARELGIPPEQLRQRFHRNQKGRDMIVQIPTISAILRETTLDYVEGNQIKKK